MRRALLPFSISRTATNLSVTTLCTETLSWDKHTGSKRLIAMCIIFSEQETPQTPWIKTAVDAQLHYINRCFWQLCNNFSHQLIYCALFSEWAGTHKLSQNSWCCRMHYINKCFLAGEDADCNVHCYLLMHRSSYQLIEVLGVMMKLILEISLEQAPPLLLTLSCNWCVCSWSAGWKSHSFSKQMIVFYEMEALHQLTQSASSAGNENVATTCTSKHLH